MVDEGAAKRYRISVGDSVPFQAFRQGQFGTGVPKGAKFDLKVTAVIREPSQFLFTDGFIFLSPGTHTKYGKSVERIDNGHVQLRDPAHDMDKLRRDAGRLLAKGTPILDLHSVERRIGTAISVEQLAQLLLGLAVGSRRSCSLARRWPDPCRPSTTTPSSSVGSGSPAPTAPSRRCCLTSSPWPLRCR